MIYFIACPEAGAVKIRLTSNPVAYRMATIQICCPLKLEVLASCEGSFQDEKRLHQRFAECRIRGEWFRLTDELRDHIATLSRTTLADAA